MSNPSNTVLDTVEARTLLALRTLGGLVEHEGGFATRMLVEHEPSLDSVRSKTLRSLEEYGLVARTMKGKRTYRIELTDEGAESADRLAPLTNGTPDISDVSHNTLINELFTRLNGQHGEGECHKAENCQVNAFRDAIDQIQQQVDALDNSKSTWHDCFGEIKSILQGL